MRSIGRRRFVAAVGGAAIGSLAGCSLLEGNDDPPRFEPEELDAILAESAPDVDRPAPIQPAETAIEAASERIEELLAAVPGTISPERVPNGVVRENIESIRARAVDGRDGIAEAPDRFRALRAARRPRRDAREAAVSLAAVDEEELETEVRRERDRVVAELGDRLDALGYEGEERSRTLLLSYRLETDLRRERSRTRRPTLGDDSGVLDVGEVAGRTEAGAAVVETVDHLVDRHRERVTAPGSFESAFRDALRESLEAIEAEDRLDDANAEDVLDRELERQDARLLFDRAVSEVAGHEPVLRRALDAEHLAFGLETALSFERDRRAFEIVRDRLRDEELPPPASVDRVRNEREAALSAAEAVPVDRTELSLAADVLVREIEGLRSIDDSLDRSIEAGREISPSREYARYALVRGRLEALPEAIDTLEGRL